jgi:hypothetical protein
MREGAFQVNVLITLVLFFTCSLRVRVEVKKAEGVSLFPVDMNEHFAAPTKPVRVFFVFIMDLSLYLMR